MRDLDRYPKVFLQTGDCYLGVQPTLVTTVLGSCVAVTMCAQKRGIGAICHAFLPDSSKNGAPQSAEPQICRFVDTALESMIASLGRLKIAPEELVVKIFGGASSLKDANRGALYDVGSRNLDAAHQWLASRGISVARSAIGGSQGRKLLFLTHTGDVWVKVLNKVKMESQP